jgi:hypothetical protein
MQELIDVAIPIFFIPKITATLSHFPEKNPLYK